MSKKLSCLKKRDLLHNPQVNGQEISRLGWDFLKQDRLVDALDFFEKAQDMEGIRQIRERGIEAGDPFLVKLSSKLLKEPAPAEVWGRVGEKAFSDGRFQQALTAYKVIQDEEQIERIQNRIRSENESKTFLNS